MSHSSAHALPAALVERFGVLRARQLVTVDHPDWCDLSRCEIRIGAVRHVGHPDRWYALVGDMEFSLSKMRRDDDKEGYLYQTRHLAVFDIHEIELFDGDFDALLLARMRVQLAEQEGASDTQEIPVVVPAEDVTPLTASASPE